MSLIVALWRKPDCVVLSVFPKLPRFCALHREEALEREFESLDAGWSIESIGRDSISMEGMMDRNDSFPFSLYEHCKCESLG